MPKFRPAPAYSNERFLVFLLCKMLNMRSFKGVLIRWT